MEVFSKPHFGGDGLAFWVLAGDMDPSFSSEPDSLNGPIFGMKSEFKGFGVLFDVYDNDNRRNNPSVFVLEV
jgi:mannose-binding lectin 1